MLTLDNVYRASYVLKDVVRKTDVIYAPKLCPGSELYLKTENLQVTGSFKVRGAYFKISQLSPEEKARGVVACSAGNHAQGVALGAKKNNIKAIDDDESATDKDQDLLITMEVVYEFYLRGLEFLPIDIYKSHATMFLIEDGKIRPPFLAVPGLGENAAWNLMEGREGRTFVSIEEVAQACPKVSKTHMEMLKEAGAFGSMPETNQVSLF